MPPQWSQNVQILPTEPTAALLRPRLVRCDNHCMASEIVVALIGGGAGLATGVVGSLFAPWANWGVEKRRQRQANRVERIKEWRNGVTELRKYELGDGKQVAYRKPASLGDQITGRPEVVLGGVQSPEYANVYEALVRHSQTRASPTGVVTDRRLLQTASSATHWVNTRSARCDVQGRCSSLR